MSRTERKRLDLPIEDAGFSDEEIEMFKSRGYRTVRDLTRGKTLQEAGFPKGQCAFLNDLGIKTLGDLIKCSAAELKSKGATNRKLIRIKGRLGGFNLELPEISTRVNAAEKTTKKRQKRKQPRRQRVEAEQTGNEELNELKAEVSRLSKLVENLAAQLASKTAEQKPVEAESVIVVAQEAETAEVQVNEIEVASARAADKVGDGKSEAEGYIPAPPGRDAQEARERRQKRRELKEIAEAKQNAIDAKRKKGINRTPDQLREHGLFFTDDILLMEPPTANEIEMGKTLLEDQFDLFHRFRKTTSPVVRIAARNDLVVRNRGLAWRFMRQYPWHEVIKYGKTDVALDFDDMWQVGFIALMRSIESYDYTMGYRFSTYANGWIRHHITRQLQNSGEIRVPVHMWDRVWASLKTFSELKASLHRDPTDEELRAEMGLDTKQFATLLHTRNLIVPRLSFIAREMMVHNKSRGGRFDDEELDELTNRAAGELDREVAITDAQVRPEPMEVIMDRNILREKIRKFLGTAGVLTDAERFILVHRFGLHGGPPETLEQVGQQRGVTRERIRQIQEVAFSKLRDSDLWDSVAKAYWPDNTEDVVRHVGLESVRASIGSDGDEVEEEEPASEYMVRLTLEEVVDLVCSHYDLTRGQLMMRTRKQEIAFPRQVLMYLLRVHGRWSFPRIGEELNRDHTMAIHACEKIERLKDEDERVKADLIRLERILNGQQEVA